MKVTLERHGGFTGISRHVEVETTALPTEQRRAVEDALKFTARLAKTMPDERTYTLTTPHSSCRVEIPESMAPEALGDLIRRR